ncbi:hypothetical protein BH09VER1_BH09VER1_34320 [soil metagenome]
MLTNDSHPTCGILYIDDEEKALKYFRMAFSDKFKVFTASSGKEGIETLRREAKDIGIVISDQRMPEMLGAEILETVRHEYPNIVRILTTAYSDLDSAIQAVNKGHIYQYAVKPWEIPDLGMVLQRAADYYQVLSERNELLALKMTTLQRIVCSDRLKWLLLCSRSWSETSQSALRRVLSALIQALPEAPDSLIASQADARHFEIVNLIRGEYQNGIRCLEAVETTLGTPEIEMQTFINTLMAKYNLSSDQAILSGPSPDLNLQLSGSTISENAILEAAFGVLFERETSELSLSLFRSLNATALAGGSLTTVGDNWKLTLPLAQSPAPSPDEIIDGLAAKFAKWDISRL